MTDGANPHVQGFKTGISPHEVCLPEVLHEDILPCGRSNLADVEQNISHSF